MLSRRSQIRLREATRWSSWIPHLELWGIELLAGLLMQSMRSTSWYDHEGKYLLSWMKSFGSLPFRLLSFAALVISTAPTHPSHHPTHSLPCENSQKPTLTSIVSSLVQIKLPCLQMSLRKNPLLMMLKTAVIFPSQQLWITWHQAVLWCNVPLHLITVSGNRTHEGLPRYVPMSHGLLIWFVTASHYVIVPTVPIVVDMTHYVIVTTVFPPNTLFHTIAL